MGFWKKEGKTVFVRNEAGKIIAVQHLGDQPKESKTPVSNALIKKYYEEHPEKTRRAKAGRVGKKILDTGVSVGKRIDKYAVNYAKSQQRSSGKPLPPLGSFSFTPFGSNSPKPKKKPQPRTKYIIVGGKAYPIAGPGKKKKKSTSKRRKYDPNNPFFFPDLFD